MITISFINYWKDPRNDNYFVKFIEKNIGPVKKINCDQNPDILIASCMGNIDNIRKLKAKSKIFYHAENLDRYPPYNNDKLLYELFDLIICFKNTNLEKKIIKFPLWMMYHDYYNYNIDDNILTYIQSRYNENIKNKKDIFATIVSRHDRQGQRTKIFDELSKYGVIKSPGNYRKNTHSIGKTHEDKIKYISRGVYNICPENSAYEGYFTEKIFQAFEGGTIPLYWASELPEPEIINKNKYCFCDINDNIRLKKKIHDVVVNKNKYIEGDLFCKNSGKIIENFYNVLLENILLLIKC